jgi:two-component system, OmpR family, sensor kinase
VSGIEFMPQQVAQQQGPPPTTDGRPETLTDDQQPRARRLWLRSLTSRLVAGVVSLVVVLVTIIGGATYFQLRSFLTERLDQQLDSTITSSSALKQVFGTTDQGTFLRPLDVWAAAISFDGELLAYPAPGAAEPLKLTPEARTSVAHMNAGTPITVTTTDGRELRVEASNPVSATIGGAPVRIIAVVGLSTDEEHRTLGRLLTLELIIGMGAVLLAFGATSWGVQRGLRNLYRVTDTAKEVAAELSPEGKGLDRRVPVVEEGTEVGQLAESMNTLLSAVETQFAARLESERRMRQFLADASHELRTPLTSIRGYAELARMQRAADGETTVEDSDNLDRIESEGTRMSRLVDDLLLLARGDADGAAHLAERTAVDVAEVIEDAVTGSRAAYPDRTIDVEIAPTPIVVGDQDQLLRVVRNLINNAAVHTTPGRPILVRGFRDTGGAVITVADGGPGLPPDQAAHVFERFWRADKARTRARGGTGLGLSIVAAIVRAHGGSVRFDSAVETGSTVTVWLPAATE